MKRLFAIALALCSLFALTIPVYAADGLPSVSNIVTNETEYFYLDDGSVIVSTLVVENVPYSDAQTRAISYGRKGTRTVTCYDDEEKTDLEWSFVFTAYFWVNEGIHSECNNTEYTCDIIKDSWKLEEATTWDYGDTGYATATMIEKLLFITLRTVDISLHLTCDIYGNVT